MITVAELIEILKKKPQHLTVLHCGLGGMTTDYEGQVNVEKYTIWSENTDEMSVTKGRWYRWDENGEEFLHL